MKKKYDRYRCHRSIRTTQEHRANGKRSDPDYKWARAKRCSNNLPDSWSDVRACYQKTWKHKRETQYRVGGRGKRHVLHLDFHVKEWELQDYFEEHDIPYEIKRVRESRWRWSEYRNDWYHYCVTVGFVMTYWTDKDIGIEYIL